MPRRTLSLDDIAAMSSTELREHWQRLYKAAPPKLPPDLLRQGIAYPLQEKRHGGLSRAAKARRGKSVSSLVATPPALPKYRPGTCLVREWHGKSHTVAVGTDGFYYEGKRYASLTAIAREITGARWSGPRFFGVTCA